LTLHVYAAEELTAEESAEMLALCSLAFEMEYEPLYRTLGGAVHVLARVDDRLVSHALWVTRWLEVGSSERYPDGLGLLRTAYVEAVATHPDYRRRGYAAMVMQRLAREISGYDLAALSAAIPELYLQLGWESWQGPLSVRVEGELQPTPDDEVMILRLPATPPLDLDAPLSCEWREGEVW
jgi:aminoglycoside 2'-N-acetyltransferase I